MVIAEAVVIVMWCAAPVIVGWACYEAWMNGHCWVEVKA
jgi:hypothetical protein